MKAQFRHRPCEQWWNGKSGSEPCPVCGEVVEGKDLNSYKAVITFDDEFMPASPNSYKYLIADQLGGADMLNIETVSIEQVHGE